MYSLDCSYYKKEFSTAQELMEMFWLPEWIRIMIC